MTFCSCTSHSGISSFLVFNPHEILSLVLNFILEAWKLKTTLAQIENRRLHVFWSKWRMCIWSGTQIVYVSENHLGLNRWCECSVNFILEQHLFWNHSRLVSCKQTIRWQHDSKAWTWNNSSTIQGVTLLPSHHASTDTPARASYTL